MAPLLWAASALVAALLAPAVVEGLRVLDGDQPAPSARADGFQPPGRPIGVVGGGHAAAAAASAKAICAEADSVRLATSTLRQLGPQAALDELRVSAEQLSDYFVASAGSVRAFLRELSMEAAEAVDVAALCSRSLEHIADVLKWAFPERRGHLCVTWSPELRCLDWVPMSGRAVQEKAARFDLAAELARFPGRETSSPRDDLVHRTVAGRTGGAAAARAAAFEYSVGELAVQIANLFDIYPTDPVLSSTSSFLEASAEASAEVPPVFGPRVSAHRYPIWRATMARSEAWVDSAFRKLATHPRLLQAWFGSDAPSMRGEVRRVLAGIKRTLGKAKIKVGAEYGNGQPLCHDETGVFAYVMTYTTERGDFVRSEMESAVDGIGPPDRYVINVCPRYWLPTFWDQDASRYGTMIHEASHHHGPTDVQYKASGPYGQAPCLRMAGESPKDAVNNADNFQWYVYYLNRCAGVQSIPLEEPPCGFKIRRGILSGAEVSLSCDGRPVSGLTLGLIQPSGEYAEPARKFGDELRLRAWTTEIIRGSFGQGQTVVLLYESDCAFWEARAAYDALGDDFSEHRARPAMDMADDRRGHWDGADDPPSPARTPGPESQGGGNEAEGLEAPSSGIGSATAPGAAHECEGARPEEARRLLDEGLAGIVGLASVKEAAGALVSAAVVEALARRYRSGRAGEAQGQQSFAFLGPPGTGKTTVARLLGKAFCALGMVRHTGFVEVRPDQLIGQFLGQTGEKTREMLAPGLGGVIFVDEAYLLTSGGDSGPNQYQQECVGALMALLDQHKRDTVFVFAGYENDMEQFFASNLGLKRRIHNIFRFAPFDVDSLVEVLRIKIRAAELGVLPDLSADNMVLLTEEFAALAEHNFDMLWPFVGGLPANASGVPERFVHFVHARVAQVLSGALDGQEDVNVLLAANHKLVAEGKAPLGLDSTAASPDGLTKLMDTIIRPVVESAPAEMRGKTNGGLADTILAGARLARADRILRDGLLDQEVGCATTAKLSSSSGFTQELFAETCPDLLFYTAADLAAAVRRAVASWTGDGDGAGAAADGPPGGGAAAPDSAESKAWFAPYAEQWRRYGGRLEEAAQWRRQLGDPGAEEKARPLLFAAQQAAAWATALASGLLAAPPGGGDDDVAGAVAELMGDDPEGLKAAGLDQRPSDASADVVMQEEEDVAMQS